MSWKDPIRDSLEKVFGKPSSENRPVIIGITAIVGMLGGIVFIIGGIGVLRENLFREPGEQNFLPGVGLVLIVLGLFILLLIDLAPLIWA